MADVKVKTQITIDKINVTKCWDKSVKRPVSEAAAKVMEKALRRVSSLQYVKSIKSKDKGLGVSMTFTDIAYDAKKRTLALKLEILVSKYPGPKIATTGGSPAKLMATRLDEKAALKEAPLLAGDLVDSQTKKLISVVQALAKSL